jgi:hypothetical protein
MAILHLTKCPQIAWQGIGIVLAGYALKPLKAIRGISRLRGTFIQNAFLKLRFEYYWKIVFEMHRDPSVPRPPL